MAQLAGSFYKRHAATPKQGCGILSVYGFRFCFTPLAGVLFAFPSRYFFAIGSCGVFSLGSWSTRIPAGFHVPRRTQVPHHEVRSISPTRLSRSPAGLPMPFRYAPVFSQLHGSSPCGPTTPLKAVWASPVSLAATPGISGGSLPFLISFPELLRWFTSLSMAPPDYFIHPRGACLSACGLPHSAIRGSCGYVLLAPAFRSLSRPSSPRSSMASAINLYSLDHITVPPSAKARLRQRGRRSLRRPPARPPAQKGYITYVSFPCSCVRSRRPALHAQVDLFNGTEKS